MTETICDGEGNVIATAAFRVSDDGLTVVLARLRNKGALLNYYFVNGGRKVMLDTGEVRISGSLQTRWQGSSRIWLVKLDAGAPMTRAAGNEAVSPGATGTL